MIGGLLRFYARSRMRFYQRLSRITLRGRPGGFLRKIGAWALFRGQRIAVSSHRLFQPPAGNTPFDPTAFTGKVYFWIRRQDLARSDFSKVWLIQQCH